MLNTRNVFFTERFRQAFRSGLINKFGYLPTANKVAIEFNLRNYETRPISRESIRKWLVGSALPEMDKLEILVKWLNLNPAYLFSKNEIADERLMNEPSKSLEISQLASYTLRKVEQLAQTALNFASPRTAILDNKGNILMVNNAWRAEAMIHSTTLKGKDTCEGINYLSICDNVQGDDAEEALKMSRSIREVISDHTKVFNIKYVCHSQDEKRWFLAKISAFSDHQASCFIVSHQKITEDNYKQDYLIV